MAEGKAQGLAVFAVQRPALAAVLAPGADQVVVRRGFVLGHDVDQLWTDRSIAPGRATVGEPRQCP